MEEVIQYKGYKINIKGDDYCESPDDWSNNNLFLVYTHRDFTVKRKGFEPKDIYRDLSFKELFRVFRVYAYIHGGVNLSLANTEYPFNDIWDVSTTGYVLVSKKEFDNKDGAFEAAKSLIESWNDYLNGDVYRFSIVKETTCKECGHTESKLMDCCGGFYGDAGKNDCIDEAKPMIDSYGK